MATASLGDVLSMKKQVGIIQTIMGGLNVANYPAGLLTTFNNDYEGNTGTYLEVKGVHTTARFNEWGTRGHTQNGESIGERAVTLLSSGEEKGIDPMAIVLLRGGVPANIEKVAIKIQNERENFIMRGVNLRKAAAASAITTGQISYDKDYNLLPDATGNFNSVDFDVPAGNKGDISGIIDASWATSTTDIPTQIKKIQTKSEQDSGHLIEVALVGDKILSYLANNDFVKSQWAGSSASFSDAVLTNNIPAGFLGIREWIYFGAAFYEDAAGTKQNWLGDDDVVFMPTVNKSWWEIGQGTTPIASTYEPMQTEQEAIDSIQLLRGAFAYAFIDRGDMSVKFAQGDCFLPTVKNGRALYLADVTP